MRRRDLVGSLLLMPALAAGCSAPAVQAPQSLDTALQPYLASHGLPAIAAAAVVRGEVIAVGAVGTRRNGLDIPVTVNDRFHIGSDTKAMTALLAATFVEEGALRWDSTVGEVFPDLVAGMNPGLKQVTLRQLLSHSSGIPSDNQAFIDLIGRAMALDGVNLDEMRAWMVRAWRTRALATPPGTRFAYANMGYILAGAMIERITGRGWEELMVVRVFMPLGLKTAGFGPQSSLGLIDAPLGHVIRADGSLKPMLAGPNGDNPPVLGPAGVVHLSILDFANWAGWNAGEGRRGPAIVRPETLRLLHTKVIDTPPLPNPPPGTPSTGGYAMGWGIVTPAWARGPLITHTGSNQINLAMIWLAPEQDFAMVMATNIGGPKADAALRAVAEALYRQYGTMSTAA